MEPATTLVLGATSLVGRFLLPKLAAEPARALAISRAPPPDGGGLTWLAADLGESGLGERLPPLETVFSLSPIWLLPDALPALIGCEAKRVIAFSSTSRFTKAASPVAAERAVAERLAAAEARTIALCEAAGVGWTILRPTLIYAEGLDGNVSRLAGLIRRLGVLPLAGRGAGLRQPVHAADLAAAAFAVERSPQTIDHAYDLPGGETLAYRLMVQRIFEGLGRSPRMVSVPAPLWALAFRLAGPFLPGATAAMGGRMSEDLVFDPEPARRDFGWAPRAFHPHFHDRRPKA